MGYTVSYLDRDGCGLYLNFGYFNFYHAGFAVQGLLLVEDEVADAVIDVASVIVFNGLQGVGVVADEGIGTGFNETTGLHSLAGHWL